MELLLKKMKIRTPGVFDARNDTLGERQCWPTYSFLIGKNWVRVSLPSVNSINKFKRGLG